MLLNDSRSPISLQTSPGTLVRFRLRGPDGRDCTRTTAFEARQAIYYLTPGNLVLADVDRRTWTGCSANQWSRPTRHWVCGQYPLPAPQAEHELKWIRI